MRLSNIVKKISNRIRTKYYSLFFDIGSNCSFGKLTFWDCDKNSIKIGNNVIIFRLTELCAKTNLPIKISDGTFINQRCLIRPNTTIGENVRIGPGVMLITDSHEIGNKEQRAADSKYLPINIGNGCWIGANSTILGGITIGNGTIIGAGSLVNKNCEPNSIYAGNPARLIRQIE